MARLFIMAYFMGLGYLAKKYEIPARVGRVILEGVSLAGSAFSEGMGRPVLERVELTGIDDEMPPVP